MVAILSMGGLDRTGGGEVGAELFNCQVNFLSFGKYFLVKFLFSRFLVLQQPMPRMQMSWWAVADLLLNQR